MIPYNLCPSLDFLIHLWDVCLKDDSPEEISEGMKAKALKFLGFHFFFHASASKSNATLKHVSLLAFLLSQTALPPKKCFKNNINSIFVIINKRTNDVSCQFIKRWERLSDTLLEALAAKNSSKDFRCWRCDVWKRFVKIASYEENDNFIRFGKWKRIDKVMIESSMRLLTCKLS